MNLEAVDLNGTLNLIDAATQAGVEHFIYTSLFGRMLGHPNPLFHIKATCEKALEKSGMDWTVLLPGLFPEVWVGMVVGIPLQAGQPVTLVGEGNHKHSFISEGDVAAFAAACVDNPLAKNTRFEIGGASYTWTEIVTAVGNAMGNPLPVNYVQSGSDVPLVPPMVSTLLNAQETYEVEIDMGDKPTQFGVELTPLSVVLQGMFGPH
jgi:nucleoside-diphosphate-sugar epimerase